MPQSQIFISYRRDDAAGYARAVNDELSRRFGAERVFIDVDDINAGQPFSEVIASSVASWPCCGELIGKRWQGPRDGAPPRTSRRANRPAGGWPRGSRKASRSFRCCSTGPMPARRSCLPSSPPLAGTHALELDNSRYAADMARLVGAVRDALGEARRLRRGRPPGRTSTAWWWLGGVAVLAIAGRRWGLDRPDGRGCGASPWAEAQLPDGGAPAGNGEWLPR